MEGKVVQGMIGWTDPSLLKCGRFYPRASARSEELLAIYSKRFACVEVDTSNYAIPAKKAVATWVRSTPAGFLFHVKAFQLFTARSCPPNALPPEIRDRLPHQLAASKAVRLADVPSALVKQAWAAMNESLLLLHEGGRLGIVVFQFPLHFAPTQQNREYILSCRASLDARFRMAVEFRNRDWYTHSWEAAPLKSFSHATSADASGEGAGAAHEDEAGAGNAAPHILSAAEVLRASTAQAFQWLQDADLVLVGVNELRHELLSQPGPGPGEPQSVMPMNFAVTGSAGVYIRVHRREGTERILSAGEIAELARCITMLDTKGPIYVMWGTAHEDQPAVNAKLLAGKLGQDRVFAWAAQLQKLSKSLLFFLPSTPPGGAHVSREPAVATADASSNEEMHEQRQGVQEGALPEVIEVEECSSPSASLPMRRPWTCDACTFDNDAGAERCGMCDSSPEHLSGTLDSSSPPKKKSKDGTEPAESTMGASAAAAVAGIATDAVSAATDAANAALRTKKAKASSSITSFFKPRAEMSGP